MTTDDKTIQTCDQHLVEGLHLLIDGFGAEEIRIAVSASGLCSGCEAPVAWSLDA